MKVFVIALISAAVLGVGSNSKPAQNQFKPKTITTPKFTIRGVGGTVTTGPFKPKMITITPEITMTGLRGAGGAFVTKTITTPKFTVKGVGGTVTTGPFKPKTITITPEIKMTGLRGGGNN